MGNCLELPIFTGGRVYLFSSPTPVVTPLLWTPPTRLTLPLPLNPLHAASSLLNPPLDLVWTTDIRAAD